MPSLEDSLRQAMGTVTESGVKEAQATQSTPAEPDTSAQQQPEAQAVEQTEQPASQQNQSATEPQTGTARQSLFDRFREKGIDFSTKYADEDALVEGLTHLVRKFGEKQEYADLGRFIVEQPEQALTWLQSQIESQRQSEHKEPEQKQTQPQQTAASVIGEWKDEWLDQVEYDESGQLVPKPGAEPGVVAKIHAAQRRMQDFYRKLAMDPASTLQPAIEQSLKPALEKVQQLEKLIYEHQQAQIAQQHQEAVQEIFEANASWMFKGGEIKPNNFTPVGREYAEILLEESRRTPNDDPYTVASRARDILAGRLLMRSAASKKPGTKAATAATPQRAPSPAVHRPNQTEPPQQSAPPGTSGLSLAEKLRKALAESGALKS